MSNSRSFRRRAKASRHARPAGHAEESGSAQQPRRQPWNKGLALTTSPTLGTTRRWLEECVAEGFVERKGVEHTGKPGRPAILYGLSEAGRERAAKNKPVPPEVQRMQWERLRRWENAKKRGRARRNAQAQNVHAGKVARAERKLKAATDACGQAQARLLTLELVAGAITALAEADGSVAELHPEEVDALTEAGIAIRNGDGELALTGDCLEAFDRIAKPV
jgi:DNA-binding PadR family transcriptional regulator